MPVLITAFGLRPACTPNLEQIRTMIETLNAEGFNVEHWLADRGYTDKLVIPEILLELGITKSVDLKLNQKDFHPFDDMSAVWIDGWVFALGIYNGLKDLPLVPFGDAEEAEDLMTKYDKRFPFAFTAKTNPYLKNGECVQELKGPALTYKVRCPNYPELGNHRRAIGKPETECPPDIDCACGRSITIPAKYLAIRQREIYGTHRWKADYGRRSLIESANSMLRTHMATLERGFTRVFGNVKNQLLMTFMMAAVNVRTIRNWTAKRLLQDPWAALVGEPEHVYPERLQKLKRLRGLAAHFDSDSDPGGG